MKKAISLAATLALAVGILAACASPAQTQDNGGGQTAGSAATAAPTPAPAEGAAQTEASATSEYDPVQELNLRATSFGTNFDVQDMGWRWMMAICYEGIYRDIADNNGDRFELAGAESVNVSSDFLTYTFNLRKDAKWSDGVPVTAHDYVYGWTRLVDGDKAYDYASFIFNVVGAQEYYEGTGAKEAVGVKALDDYTFEVKLKVADPTFEAKLVATPLYPTREDLAEAAGDEWGKDWRLCVYNGPFAMTELVEDNKMVWSKNPYYWNAENVHLDKVNFYAVPEVATASTMFDNGELDVFNGSGDYIKKYDAQVAEGKLTNLTIEYPGTSMICYEFTNNGLSGLMGNVNIRKAIGYSINREEMVDAVYGRYSPALGLVSPGILFNGSSYRAQAESPITAEYAEYNGDGAKLQALFQKGLDELGVTTPIKDITLTLLSYGSASQDQNQREYIQQSIQQALGCKVELNTVGDSSLFASERGNFNYDIFVSAWYSDYNDPLDFLDIFRSGVYRSYGLWVSPEYDALLDSLSGVGDVAKRKEIYGKLEAKLLLEEHACSPLWYADQHYYIRNWVKGFNTSSFGGSQEPTYAYISGRE